MLFRLAGRIENSDSEEILCGIAKRYKLALSPGV
jgi:hypothetical protein